MSKPEAVFIAALSALLLAGCASEPRATAENDAVETRTNAMDAASPSGPEAGNAPAPAGAEPVPPPDAVSHPEGYLPPAPEPEPATESPPASKEAPPATEDEYIRNRQSGGRP